MMKSLLIAGAVTAAASANDIDLFATSSFGFQQLLHATSAGTQPSVAGLTVLSTSVLTAV